MAGNPIQDVLQMLMQQGGGGMPGGAGMPPGAMPPGSGNIPMMQGGPQQAEIAPLSPQAQGMMQGGEPPPTGDFLPPKMPMPQDEPTDEPPMSEEGDDPRRAETEGELEDVRSQMNGASTEDDDYEWQGDETPTAMDMQYVKENATDSVLQEFYTRFPKYMMELIMSEGGNPRQSPDQYAMDDEEFENLQSDRSTMIDER